MKESGGSSEQGRVRRSRRNWGLLRMSGFGRGVVIAAHAEALAGVLCDHLWGGLPDLLRTVRRWLHLSVGERCLDRSLTYVGSGKEGSWTDPDKCRMCEGAMCLWMPCHGEATLPGQPGMWKPGHGTHSGGTSWVSPSPSRHNCSPGPPSAYGHGSTLPRTALTSYSLRKPTWDLAAFWL